MVVDVVVDTGGNGGNIFGMVVVNGIRGSGVSGESDVGIVVGGGGGGGKIVVVEVVLEELVEIEELLLVEELVDVELDVVEELVVLDVVVVGFTVVEVDVVDVDVVGFTVVVVGADVVDVVGGIVVVDEVVEDVVDDVVGLVVVEVVLLVVVGLTVVVVLVVVVGFSVVVVVGSMVEVVFWLVVVVGLMVVVVVVVVVEVVELVVLLVVVVVDEVVSNVVTDGGSLGETLVVADVGVTVVVACSFAPGEEVPPPPLPGATVVVSAEVCVEASPGTVVVALLSPEPLLPPENVGGGLFVLGSRVPLRRLSRSEGVTSLGGVGSFWKVMMLFMFGVRTVGLSGNFLLYTTTGF